MLLTNIGSYLPGMTHEKMGTKTEELIKLLTSHKLSLEQEQVLINEYLNNQEENNQLVFRQIEIEYKRLESAILGKLLYLPYSINPTLSPKEAREYARLLNKCLVYYTGQLSTDEPDSNTIWILYMISDVLFHSVGLAQYLDEEFSKSINKIFSLNTDDYAGEIFILMERIFVIANYIDTPLAKDIIKFFKQHPNKQLVEFIVKKHEV